MQISSQTGGPALSVFDDTAVSFSVTIVRLRLRAQYDRNLRRLEIAKGFICI